MKPEVVKVAPGRSGRIPSFILGVVVAFLALAILKPWPTTAPGPSPVGGPVAIGTGASPSPTAGPVDPNGMDCLRDRAVQVLTLEQTAAGAVRSWVVVPGPLATRPTDPDVGVVHIYSSHVVGLGICTGRLGRASPDSGAPNPSAGSAQAGAVSRAEIVDVMSLHASGPSGSADELGPAAAITGVFATPDAALLYGPPGTPGGSPQPGSPALGAAVWLPGAYLLGVHFDIDRQDVVHWLRIDLRASLGGSG